MSDFVSDNVALPPAKQDANPPTGAATELDAADINNAYTYLGSVRTAIDELPRENFLPNTQWVIATALGSSTQMNAQGTGTEPPISVSSYTTGSNTVTCTCSGGTGNLVVGDLVTFSAAADVNLKLAACRVTTVTPGTSFVVKLPLNKTASSSAACTAIIWQAGGASSAGSGDAFDGWTKSTTAQVWRETNSVNLLAGSTYSCGIMKGANTSETMNHTPPSTDIGKFIGRNVVFGGWVYQKIKGGSGTFRAYISSDGTGGTTTYSTSGTSGAWQWLEVKYTVPSNATTVSFGFSFDGVTSDVYYVSQPMGSFGNVIGQGNYAPRFNEILIPKVKMTPATFIGATVTFPSVLSNGDYNFSIDWYAETNGAIAPTTKGLTLQLEGKDANVGESMCLRDVLSAPIKYACVIYSQVSNVMQSQAHELTLDGSGYSVIYSNTSGSIWQLVSIDVNRYLL